MACFTTLYSGSSGNCAFLEEDGRFVLVDMGKSARAATRALAQLGAQAKQLCGVMVTHEHSDHIAGLAVFLKKHPVPVYGTCLLYTSPSGFASAGAGGRARRKGKGAFGRARRGKKKKPGLWARVPRRHVPGVCAGPAGSAVHRGCLLYTSRCV